jgi:hypothetical protein
MLVLGASLAQSALATPEQVQQAVWTDCPGARDLVGVHPELADCVAKSGAVASEAIRFRLGDSKEALNAQSSLPIDFNHFYFTDTPVDLTWMLGKDEFLFDDVGGTGQSVLVLDLDYHDKLLSRITFNWQNRPLSLGEAMARAKSFEAWLVDRGFAALTIGGEPTYPFAIIERNVHPPKEHSGDWASAEAKLSSEDEFVERMMLYRLALAETEVRVAVQNNRRSSWNFGGGRTEPPGFRRSIYDGTGGYEWSLEIEISRSTAS